MKKPRTSELHRLIRTGKAATYTKGQIIQSTEGQKTINLITGGFVKRYLVLNTGNLGVEVVYGPGNVFPLTLVLSTFFDQMYSGPEVYFYEAICDTTLYRLEVDALVKAVSDQPLLYKDLLFESGRRLESTLNSLENLTLNTPYNRVAQELMYLAKQFGRQMAHGVRIMLPIAAQDLADILSIDVDDVACCLEELEGKGVVKVSKYIAVPNIEKLSLEAYN